MTNNAILDQQTDGVPYPVHSYNYNLSLVYTEFLNCLYLGYKYNLVKLYILVVAQVFVVVVAVVVIIPVVAAVIRVII